jgi:hypothetical protein
MQTAKHPVTGTLTQFRSVRIPFNVPRNHQEVLVTLDGERFESTLIDMP